MDAVRSIRIHLPDRPGSLSLISTALAVHDVNIVRLRVVSHEGATVIDDLDLSAASGKDLDRAIAGFAPDVRVECFESTLGDPVVRVADGIKALALSGSVAEALAALVEHAPGVVRADAGTVLEVSGEAIKHLAGVPMGALGPAEESALREAAATGSPAALSMGEGGSALPFTGLAAAYAAVSRIDTGRLLAVARRSPISFATGELERLAAFSEAAGTVLALK